MTTFGWILMILTWGSLVTLMVSCYKRILSEEDSPALDYEDDSAGSTT